VVDVVKQTAEKKRRREKEKKEKAKQFKANVEAEMEKILHIVAEQRIELQEEIAKREAAFNKGVEAEEEKRSFWKKFSRSQKRTEDEARLNALKRFWLEFHKKWGLNMDGTPREPTWWEKKTHRTFAERLRAKITKELYLTDQLDEELEKMDPYEREKRLLEYGRLDYLDTKERVIYMRAHGEMEEDEEPEPVHYRTKVLAWIFVALYNLGMGFYVCLFG